MFFAPKEKGQSLLEYGLTIAIAAILVLILVELFADPCFGWVARKC